MLSTVKFFADSRVGKVDSIDKTLNVDEVVITNKVCTEITVGSHEEVLIVVKIESYPTVLLVKLVAKDKTFADLLREVGNIEAEKLDVAFVVLVERNVNRDSFKVVSGIEMRTVVSLKSEKAIRFSLSCCIKICLYFGINKPSKV